MLHLREIELFGFKSFVERLRLPLPGHFMAVVGPNGSGKSNIADAVLWALGEQSPKSLRGQKMQDVIFNGSHRRPPAGMAEVFLVFEDAGNSRIRVGRRLLRTGESAYLMDGRPVRLKDIHDFLQRHQVSIQGTFLVEQGRVSALLTASAEERRLILEEVAGIAHYKENRKSALQKLEATETNLTRLKDIIQEVDGQMASLKKQAAKADRYARLSDELRARRRAFWGRSLALALARREGHSRDLLLLRDEFEKRQTLVSHLGSEWEGAKGRQAEHESSLGNLVQQIHRRELDRERLEQENRRRTEQILAGQGRLRQIGADVKDLEKRAASLEKEGDKIQSQRSRLEEEERKAQERLDASRQALESVRSQVEARSKELEAARAEAFRLAQEASTHTAHIQRLDDDLKRQEERIKRFRKDEEGLAAREREAQESLEDRRAEAAQAERLAAAAREASRKAEEALGEAEQEAREAARVHGESQKALAAEDARSKVLKDQEGALRSSAHEALGKLLPGPLPPTVAEAMAEAPAPLLAALTCAYGPLLEAYGETPWEGLPEILASLADRKAGTAEFLLRDGRPGGWDPPDGAEGFPGFQGWLPDMSGLGPSVARHLPRVALVEEPGQARAFAERFGAGAVSRGGIFADPLGRIRGGAGGSGGEALLAHELEKKKCLRALASARKAAADNEVRLREATLAAECCKETLTGARASLESALAEARRLSSEVQRAEEEIGRLSVSRELLAGESAQVVEEYESWTGQREELVNRQVETQKRIASNREALKGHEDSLAGLRQSQERAHEDLTEKTAGLTEVAQGVLSAVAAEKRNADELRDLESTRGRLTRESAGLEARGAALTTEVTEGDRSLQALLLALTEDLKSKTGFEEALEALKAGCAAAERAVKEASESAEEVRRDLGQQELLLNTAESEVRHLRDRIGEVFPEAPEELAAEHAGADPLGDEEREALQRGLLRLEERINEIGAVNMLARQEYEELEKREAFLSEQRKDLEESIAALQETIRKINRTSRERFLEAFTAVQEHFGHLFREVFDGGEARLSILDEANPMESGVEIFAQPPGKKLQHMNLLSGGEKAKVALALLFAFFKFRPHPFFILDEVDAPLDDANIGRFNHLLNQFRGQTQFLVISHNKRTMELADVLYGVTMVEGGVSRVVSVQMAEVEQEVAARER